MRFLPLRPAILALALAAAPTLRADVFLFPGSTATGTPNTGLFFNVLDGSVLASTIDPADADPLFSLPAFTHLVTWDGLAYAQPGYGFLTDGFGNALAFDAGDALLPLGGVGDFAFIQSTLGGYSYLGFSTDAGDALGYVQYLFGPDGFTAQALGTLGSSPIGSPVLASQLWGNGGGSTAAQIRQQKQAQRLAAERARRR